MNNNEFGLFEKLSKLQWLMHRLQLKKSAENGPMADTTRGQGRILAILKLQDGISTKDLSYLLGIRVSSLNELLAKMEKTEYITREPSETDRRVMLVKLTEKGRTEEQKEWNPEDIFSCLSEEEQTVFAVNLDQVIQAVEGEVGIEASEDERDWWLGAGRERMGDEPFERLTTMWRGRGPHPEGFNPHHRPEDFSPEGMCMRTMKPGHPRIHGEGEHPGHPRVHGEGEHPGHPRVHGEEHSGHPRAHGEGEHSGHHRGAHGEGEHSGHHRGAHGLEDHPGNPVEPFNQGEK